MDPSVNAVLQKFLTPPKAKGTDFPTIVAKVRYWIDVANHPEEFSTDHSPFALSAKRRSARQNVRRLLTKYPQAASLLRSEVSEEQK